MPARKTISATAKANAPALRKRMTSAERQLWRELRALRSELGGTHFRRQVPVGPYIADFCCLGQRLIVEVDGEIHRQVKTVEYDRQRDDYLCDEGFRVLRFSNREISLGMDSVMKTIRAAFAAPPTPGPSPQGGGEHQRAAP